MIDTFLYIISQTTGFSKSELLSRRRTAALRDARFCLYLVLVESTNLSLSEVARQLRKDHTTIISGVNKARDKRRSDPVFAHLYRTITNLLSEEIQNGWHDKHRMFVEFPSRISEHRSVQ